VLGHLDHALLKYRQQHFQQQNHPNSQHGAMMTSNLSDFFVEYRIQRYCCRRILLCSVDVHPSTPVTAVPTMTPSVPNKHDTVFPSTVTVLERTPDTTVILPAI
jgi:DNA-directed RNA polymerase subunit N (RpoN/RPB10)